MKDIAGDVLMSLLARAAGSAAVFAVFISLITIPTLARSQSQPHDSVPALEDQLLQQLKNGGIGNRFHIKEIKPRCFSKVLLRYTKTKDAMIGEFDEDRFALDECAIGIYRYDGEVKMGPYTFIGEGDKTNRLTFVLIDVGYVYLRGKGKVVLPNGQTVALGD